MSGTPRILVLAPDVPFPIRAGGQMRMASLVDALAAAGRVHLAVLAPEISRETLQWCTERGISISHRPRLRVEGLRLWRERLVMALARCNLAFRPEERDFFHGEWERFQPDLVWLETPYLVRYALAHAGGVPIIVDYWGTSEGAERDYRSAEGPRKVWEWLRWRAARGGERRFAPRLDAIVAVSETDAAYFRTLAPGVPVYAVPNGIVKKYERDYSKISVNPDQMIFTGDLAYRPNVDAVRFFVTEILPRIRERCPAARFKAVGRAPLPEVAALAEPGKVEIAGFVPDLAEPIVESALYVLPMRLGSGIRSKLFDVFPLGKAIVTTSVGAEGLALRDGENCRIADTPADFAAACAELLEDPAARKRLEQGARRLAEEEYSQDRIRERVADILQRFADSRESRSPERTGAPEAP